METRACWVAWPAMCNSKPPATRASPGHHRAFGVAINSRRFQTNKPATTSGIYRQKSSSGEVVNT